MTLPASQYSVLDAKQIERIDDSTFRCYVGGLRFLGFTIDPVLTVSVNVTDKGPTVRLLSTKVSNCSTMIPASLLACMPFPNMPLEHSLIAAENPIVALEEQLLTFNCVQLEGSPAVEAANDRFSATMENKVRWGSSAEPGLLELRSDTSIQVVWNVVSILACPTCSQPRTSPASLCALSGYERIMDS